MSRKPGTRAGIRVKADDIKNSAVAVGDGAIAANDARKGRFSEADAELDRLIGLLDAHAEHIEQKDELRSDVKTVQYELRKKQPNIGMIVPALKGIAASLAPVQALAGIALNVLEMVRHVA